MRLTENKERQPRQPSSPLTNRKITSRNNISENPGRIVSNDPKSEGEFEEEADAEELETLWEKFAHKYPFKVSTIRQDLQAGQLGPHFNDDILVMLSPYIENHCLLQRINFSYPCTVTDIGLEALAEAVDFKNVRSINLSNNVIKAEGFKALTSMFPMPLLEELNLSNTEIMSSKDEELDPTKIFSFFLDKLTKCCNLKYLNLSSKNEVFSTEMVRSLADALPWLTMDTFVFGNNLITLDQAIATLEILEAGFRWNLTITIFEMPCWLEQADHQKDVCQSINRYFMRNYLFKNNTALLPSKEQLSITRLSDNCTRIILDYLYKYPESFVEFINSKINGRWVETPDLYYFKLDKSFPEKKGALEFKKHLESSLEKYHEINETFQVQSKKR